MEEKLQGLFVSLILYSLEILHMLFCNWDTSGTRQKLLGEFRGWAGCLCMIQISYVLSFIQQPYHLSLTSLRLEYSLTAKKVEFLAEIIFNK